MNVPTSTSYPLDVQPFLPHDPPHMLHLHISNSGNTLLHASITPAVPGAKYRVVAVTPAGVCQVPCENSRVAAAVSQTLSRYSKHVVTQVD